MPAGLVKTWFDTRGFGFITSDDGEDFFVHQSDIKINGPLRALIPRMRVEFVIGKSKKGRKKAVQVTGPNGTPIQLFARSEAPGPKGKQETPLENPPKGSPPKGSPPKGSPPKGSKDIQPQAKQLIRAELLKLQQIKQQKRQKRAKVVTLKKFQTVKNCSGTKLCVRNETTERQHALVKAFHKCRAMEYIDDWDIPLV